MQMKKSVQGRQRSPLALARGCIKTRKFGEVCVVIPTTEKYWVARMIVRPTRGEFALALGSQFSTAGSRRHV